MTGITTTDWAHEKLKTLRDEYNKEFYPSETDRAKRMTLSEAVEYLITGYEKGMYIIEPGMFDPDNPI